MRVDNLHHIGMILLMGQFVRIAFFDSVGMKTGKAQGVAKRTVMNSKRIGAAKTPSYSASVMVQYSLV